MKKILGYGVVYLFGLLCILGMMFRVDSLDSKVASESTETNNIYALNN